MTGKTGWGCSMALRGGGSGRCRNVRMDREVEARREGWLWMKKGLFGHDRVYVRLTKSTLAVLESESGKERMVLDTLKCRLFPGWESEINVKSATKSLLFKSDGGREEFVKWWRAFEAAICPAWQDYYTPMEVIGEGQTAVVISAMERCSGREVALKMIGKKQNGPCEPIARHVSREVEVTKAAECRNVMKLYDSFATNDDFILVLEKGENNLLKLLEDRVVLTEHEARTIMRQLLKTTADLHARGIAHRDLKLENVLCNIYVDGEIEVLIGDFGSAGFGIQDPTETKTDSFSAHVGTTVYMAPERWTEKRYGTQVDTFALGVIMYALLSGMFPFPMQGCMLSGKFLPPSFGTDVWSSVSPGAKSLISGLLQQDPKKRLGSVAALRHAWIVNEGPKKERLSSVNPALSRRTSLPAIEQPSSLRTFKNVAMAQVAISALSVSVVE